MRTLVAAVVMLALLAGPAAASERQPTLAELEGEVMCPTCKSTLDHSTSPIADRIRAFISERIAAGDTRSEIKAKLVEQFGQEVLAAPSTSGFNLLAWVLPFAGVGVGAVALGALAWRWTQRRSPAPAVAAASLDPELDRRLDEELARFDG